MFCNKISVFLKKIFVLKNLVATSVVNAPVLVHKIKKLVRNDGAENFKGGACAKKWNFFTTLIATKKFEENITKRGTTKTAYYSLIDYSYGDLPYFGINYVHPCVVHPFSVSSRDKMVREPIWVIIMRHRQASGDVWPCGSAFAFIAIYFQKSKEIPQNSANHLSFAFKIWPQLSYITSLHHKIAHTFLFCFFLFSSEY